MLYYTIGDATQPSMKGPIVIAHVCNDIGGWGRGFVLSVSRRWSKPETEYRAWSARALGKIQLISVERDVFVCNMVAQHDIRTIDGLPPIRYEALRECLIALAEWAQTTQSTIHMPRIGCGLAGGEWSKIEPILNETLKNIDVYVYDLPNNPIPWKK